MTNKEIPESFEDKLVKALRDKAVLGERSKLLGKQMQDYRTREQMMQHIASELLERQRELNYMLHRASSVLHTLQDTNLALSAEFTHIVKELPPAKDSDWEQTIERVNQLFKKTHELAGGMQEEIFRKTSEPKPPKKSKKAAKESAELGVESTDFGVTEPELVSQIEPVKSELASEPPIVEIPVPEPQVELVEPELAVEAELPSAEFGMQSAEWEAPSAEREAPSAEWGEVVPQSASQPEPEPIVEIEPQLAVEPEPEPEMEPAYKFHIEAEQEPQAFGETTASAIEEPVAEVQEETPAKAVSEFDRVRDEQIERLFRQIQPIELKPPPTRNQTSQKGFLSKLFRKDKTPV